MHSANTQADRILDRLFASGFVTSANDSLDVFSISSMAVVTDKNGTSIPLSQWLIDNEFASWDFNFNSSTARYFASKWISSEGEKVLFRPVNLFPPTWYSPEIDPSIILELITYLDKYTPVSFDQLQVIEPEHGVLAWHDNSTGLMWDAGRICNKGKSSTDNPPGMLNKIKYAGYDDWRLPTIAELKTLVTEDVSRGKHIKSPLSAMTLGPIWTKSTDDDKYAFDFSSLETLIDYYYKDNTVYAYDLSVRGNFTACEEIALNPVLDWAMKYDVRIPVEPESLKSLRKLHIIGAKYLKVEFIPFELSQLVHLEEILIYVDAEIIPKFIWTFPNLKRLDISASGDLSMVVISPTIEHLALHGAVTKLPECLNQLSNLKTLVLDLRQSVVNDLAAAELLQGFVENGGDLSLLSYMKYEDFGLVKDTASNKVKVA
ncbi:DUF1566 domain-containing protein [Pseudomonas sp. MIL9]|uniref:Lcl C-terminal domain-containing protein n=1 Tax=Pseudomonas sp. MIL9 TaxID=2807620 RepID=UPI001950953E|nr:DUF1566 domain-containing protein [Pseudomonas sp. MIL9]MBM6447542.1 DUF1566 domain-containing protein [Pseudomonas sp. MIL9]